MPKTEKTVKREVVPPSPQWKNPRNAERKFERLSEEEQRKLLAGVPRYSIGGQILLDEPLIAPSGLWLDGHAWLPRLNGDPKERFPHTILGSDLGKFQQKWGGVDPDHYFQEERVIDAYVKARAVQYDSKGSGGDVKGITSWSLLMEGGVPSTDYTSYWLGEEALPWVTGKFPLLDISQRIVEKRFREQYFAGLAMELEALGNDFFPVKGDLSKAIEAAPTHYVVVGLALPHKDMTNMTEETRQAISALKGDFVVMRQDTGNGEKEILKGHCSDLYIYDQSRGTDTAVSLQADGEHASWSEDWEEAKRGADEEDRVTARLIADLGGGDCHLYHITDKGSVAYMGNWAGAGTIASAQGLIPLVAKNHRVELTEIQAQHALATRRIRGAGGRTVRIDKEIEEGLHAERDNLIAQIDITPQNLTSLIICTGGGTPLLEKQLRAKLNGLKLAERKDYLILNAKLAPIANVAGVTMRSCFKAQIKEADFNEEVLLALIQEYDELVTKVSPRRQVHNELRSCLQQLRQYEEQIVNDEGTDLDWPILSEYLEGLKEHKEKVSA